jgi:uncharacterized membrane protein
MMADKKDKNEHVVIAVFPSKAEAESAEAGVKSWDGANDAVKLGAIGTIINENGKIKTHVPHKTGKGAGVGATVGIIAGVLSGGLTLLAGAAAGAVGGGALGAFMKQSLHLTKEEIAALGTELEGGKAALVVTCDEDEVGPTQEWLAGAGGAVRGYAVPAAALEEAVDAGLGDAVPVAEPAAEDAPAASAEADTTTSETTPT